ncbi:MAG: cation transporter [Betaproteobacteria bacterium]|nr:cation transporter [Betaproteobacteria bacterium]
MNARHSQHDHASHDERLHRSASGHAHAHHVPAGTGVRRAMTWALILTAGFALVEAAGGWWSGSLALLSDAGHMITDALALGLALFAQTVALRPPSERNSFGYARAEVLGAFVNAVFMLLVVALIVIEAVQRLLHPAPVAGGMVMGIAAAGLAVNLVVAWLLRQHHDNLNSRAAYLHVLGDMLGSVAALAAGAIIWWTGWLPADPLLSLVVSALILTSTWNLLKQSVNVLMEGVPVHLSFPGIGQALAGIPGVENVHDLHVWHMSAERVALSAHVLIDDPAHWPAVLAAGKKVLREQFAIEHVTLQPGWLEPGGKPAGRVIRLAERNAGREAGSESP